MKLQELFQRVVVISLKRRQDRRRRIEKLMKATGWPFKKPIWFDAIDGGSGLIPVPRGFISGGGAWGCKQSWTRVLEDAMADNITSILVMEDDAIWRPTFEDECQTFFENIPQDWQVAFLGGQNMATPRQVVPGIGRTANTQRTHAIALRGNGIRFAYGVMAYSDRHIDHRFGPAAGKLNKSYQPLSFIVGQDSTQSDISGRKDHARFWSSPDRSYPVCFLNASQDVAEALTEFGFHFGFDLNDDGLDRGLCTMFPKSGMYTGGIGKFLSTVSWEAASFSDGVGITTIWHPNAVCSSKVKNELPKRTVVTPYFDDLETAISWLADQFGSDVVRPRADRMRQPVALLKCPDEIVHELAKQGLVHIGRWRDEKTNLDKGLIQFFEVGGTNLLTWYKVLEREARETNVPVGIHHPKATFELAETCGRRVVIVDAVTIEEAKKQLEVVDNVE